VFLLGTVFTTLCGYFFKVYVARMLGAEALGIYALGMTVVGLAGVVAAAGLPQAATRFVAAYSATGDFRRLGRFLWSAMTVLLAANLIGGVCVMLLKSWIADRFYHTPALASYMHFFAIIMVTGALTGFLGQVLAGYKDVARRTIITSFIGQSLTMAATIVLLTLGYGFRGYLIAQIFSAMAVVFLLSRTAWNLTPPPARPLALGLPLLEREVFSFSVVLFAIQILEYLSAQTDKVMLGVFLNAREVGVYSIATALVAFVAIFLQSLNQIFAPTIAELHASGQNDLLRNLYRTLTKWVFGFTMPLAFVIMIFSRPLMEIFGREFGEGWSVLAIATLGQLVNCGVGSVGQLLLMSGEQKKMVRAQAIAVPIGLVINWILIPKLGLMGAAVAAAVTNILLNLLWLREVQKTLSILPSRRGYFLLMPPALATLAGVWLVRYGLRGSHHDFLIVIAGLTVGYSAFVLSSLAIGLDADDRMLARSAWDLIRRSFGFNPA